MVDVSGQFLDDESHLLYPLHPLGDHVIFSDDVEEHDAATVAVDVRPEDVGDEVELGNQRVGHGFENVTLVEIYPELMIHLTAPSL